MTPNMKDNRQAPDFNENNGTPDLNLLKALVQFSIQVADETREIDIKEFLRSPRKAKREEESSEIVPVVWKEKNGFEECGRKKSGSMEGKTERIPLSMCWRKPSLKRSPKKSKEEVSNTQTKEDSTPHISDILERMSLQQQLALTALNLTAPACSSILRNHRNNWVQLSGHPGSLAPAGPGTIWKKQPGDTNETWVYEALMQDTAKNIVPRFYKEILFEGEKFIEISDLLSNFNNPSMMDIKMGTRTFLESEVSNTKGRNDLYKKMIKVDPYEPTAEEHSEQAVTKLRYMDFRDNLSSSRSLGFRIEALKMCSSSSVTEMKKIRTRGEVVETLASFIQRKESTKKQVLNRLKVIKDTFEKSDFFKNHEVIGSSILIVYDDTHAGAWIIDFAKTCKLPDSVKINHKSLWEIGNHEEGYFTGLDNLIKVVEDVPTAKSRKIKFFSKS